MPRHLPIHALLALAATAAAAQQAPVPQPPRIWTLSAGISARESSYSAQNSGYSEKGWSANAVVTTPVDENWTLGGGLSYSLSTLDRDGNAGTIRPTATSLVGLATRDLGGGLSLSTTLGYGRSAVNTVSISGTTTTTYSNNSDFLSASAGLTQGFAIDRVTHATITGRYTYAASYRGPFTTSANNFNALSNSDMHLFSLGAGISRRFGRYTPYAQLDWNVSNRDVSPNTGDRDYFSFNTGVNYRYDARTGFGLSLATQVGKTNSHDLTLGANLRHSF